MVHQCTESSSAVDIGEVVPRRREPVLTRAASILNHGQEVSSHSRKQDLLIKRNASVAMTRRKVEEWKINKAKKSMDDLELLV